MDKPLETNSESTRVRRRSSSTRGSSTRRSNNRFAQLLGVGLAISLIANLFMAIAIGNYFHKTRLLTGLNSGLQQKIIDLTEQTTFRTEQIETLKHEVKTLTLDRLPGLLGLRFDEVLKINNGYVKNIVFTRTGKKGTRLYEYKLVLENNGAALQPALKVILFDRTGVQIGASELDKNVEHGRLSRLERDEVRTHYSALRLPEKTEPEYFQILLH